MAYNKFSHLVKYDFRAENKTRGTILRTLYYYLRNDRRSELAPWNGKRDCRKQMTRKKGRGGEQHTARYLVSMWLLRRGKSRYARVKGVSCWLFYSQDWRWEISKGAEEKVQDALTLLLYSQ